MGRTSDEEGESSTKVCKSDELDDRPLKKARYVWQIKGKYHLKKNDDDKVSCFPTKSSVKDESSVLLSCKHSSCKTSGSCNSELTTMECAENSSGFQNSSSTIKKESNPEKHNQVLDVAVCEESNNKNLKQDSEHFSENRPEWPAALNAMFPNTRPSTSWQLRKWQARQVARCFVDNTINRVLEDMGFVPLPVDADDILDEFPMTESDNDEGLEDEAVLMAIHRHGLRTEGDMGDPGGDNKNVNNSVKVDCTESKTCGELGSAASMPCVCSINPRQEVNSFANLHLNPFHHRPVFWDRGEMETHKLMHSPFTTELNSNEIVHRWFSDGGLFSSVISSESSCDSDMKSYEESISDEQLLSEKDSSANDVREVNSMSVDKTEETDSPKIQENTKSPSFEHSDFLDKAVAVAIQKKGLSKLSCTDYG